MKSQKSVTILSIAIILLSIVAASMGIFSDDGTGPFEVETVRGTTVTIYGQGIYQHMSAELAPQGIAQDYVTLFAGVPLLIIGLLWARKGSLRGRFLLAGTLGYFLVTYLFYLVMGMYNILFLVYVLLLSTSFFAFALTIRSFNMENLPEYFGSGMPVKTPGGFLIFNSIAIGFLWLGVVVPPLLEGTAIPEEVEHYTTLIVQGLDLSLLLPLSFIAGMLFIKRRPLGYLMAPVYLIFLSLLMAALTAKIVVMGMLDYNVVPAIYIIPTFTVISIICSITVLRNLQEPYHMKRKSSPKTER